MLKILFLAANPSDTTRLRLDQEIRAIDEKLRQTDFREKYEIEQQWAVRVSDLQGHLLRHKPNIVHFSGHGSLSSEILLEDETGGSCPVSVQALSQLFSILKDDIRCVVLNACYSEPQARAIVEHIPHVLGMTKAISDEAAIGFAAAFYQALGYGKDFKTAFELGRAQISLENLNEQDAPKFLTISNYRTAGLKNIEAASESNELTFANIAIAVTSTYWKESTKPKEFLFDRECSQFFRLAYWLSEVNPSFDITLLNTSNEPLLLTALGVEIVSVAHLYGERFGGIPKAVKVEKMDLYKIEIPDIWSRVKNSLEEVRVKNPSQELIAEFLRLWRLPSIDLHELVSIRLPDPIYFEPKAPYRYGILLDKYLEHMPNRAIIKMWVLTDRGEMKSHEVHLSQ